MEYREVQDGSVSSMEYNELDVLGFIESCLCQEEGERIIFEFDHQLGFQADAYLPMGCSKLSIPKEAYVEIIQNMPQNVLSLIKDSKSLKVTRILIVTKNLGSSFSKLSKARYKHIRFKSFAAWIKKFKILRLGYSIFSRYYGKYNSIIEQQAISSIKNNRVTLFVGAGLGSSLHLPDWNGLLSKAYLATTQLVQEADIDLVCNNDPLIKAGFLLGDIGETGISIIEKELYPVGFASKTSPLLDAICSSVKKYRDSIDSIITYNYDDYIERELRSKGVPCESVFKGIRAGKKFPIYHVHGYLSSVKGEKSSSKGEIVLTERKYHEVFNKAYSWVNVEQYHALSRNTCLFIGMSMTDPNVRRLLDAVLSESSGNDVYVIMSRETKTGQYSQDQQYVFNSTMWNLGVKVIWCEKHADVPVLIQRLFI